MAPTPPESWELATPVFGIRYPRATAPAKRLPDAFGHIGTDLENALLANAFPPGSQYKTGTQAERLAAPPTRDLIWVETDTGSRYIGTGTAWISISTQVVRCTREIQASGYAVTGAVNIGYPVSRDDTHNAWNNSTAQFVVPVAGTYLLVASMKQNNNSSGASIGLFKNNAGIGQTGNLSATPYGGNYISFYQSLAVGDAISVRTSVNYQTQYDPPHMTNFFQALRIG